MRTGCGLEGHGVYGRRRKGDNRAIILAGGLTIISEENDNVCRKKSINGKGRVQEGDLFSMPYNTLHAAHTGGTCLTIKHAHLPA